MPVKVIKNLLKVPRPRNNEELKIVSEAVFGVPLTARVSFMRYEIDQSWDSYDKQTRDACKKIIPWETCNPNYRLNDLFSKTVFGEMSCGGIARNAYGSVHPISYRQGKRLKEFASARNALSGVRPAFVRLAAQTKRERREQG